MKKVYLSPNCFVLHMQSVQMISASGVKGDSSRGIGYGGVDENGSLEADTKKFNTNFDWDENW